MLYQCTTRTSDLCKRDSRFNEFSLDEFFKSFWRKKPFVIRGGARLFWPEAPTHEDFAEIAQSLQEIYPDRVKAVRNKVIFLQNLEKVYQPGKKFVQTLSKEFQWYNITLDSVLANDKQGIGSHFDNSDNIVLNFKGKKIWRLESPNQLSEDLKRRRLLQEPEIGTFEASQYTFEWELDEGDLLYIPLLWIHWGISLGSSYSISVVFNAKSPGKHLPLVVLDKIKCIPLWTSPIPRLLNNKEKKVYCEYLYKTMIETLASKDTSEELIKLWLESI